MDLGANRIITFIRVTLPLKILSMVKTVVTPEVNALSTIIMFVVIIIISLNTGAKVKSMRKKARIEA